MPMEDAVRKRSVTIAGHRTSFSLEDAFWEELVGIAARRGVALAELVVEIDSTRDGNLSSALRLFILRDLQSRLAQDDAKGAFPEDDPGQS